MVSPAPARVACIHSVATACPPRNDDTADGVPDWWDGQLVSATGVGDRPVRLPHTVETNWMLNDYVAKLTVWKAAGFDVFQPDMLSADPHPARLLLLAQAAVTVGIAFIPQPDTNSWSGSIPAADTEAQVITECVRRLMALWPYAAAWYTDAQGRYVISPYNALATTPNNATWATQSPSRWAAILDALTAQTGQQFVLNVNLANSGTYAADIAKFKTALGSRLTGAGLWGGRSPQEATSSVSLAATAHAAGIAHQQWIRPQDNRRRDKNYSTPLATKLLRLSWLAAIGGNAELILVTTADDDYEASSLEPRMKKTDGWIWLNSFYLWQWKDNAEPAVVKDAAFVAFRQTPYAAQPTAQSWPVMVLNPSSDRDQDITDFIAFLTADATITVDGYQPVAGIKGVNVITVAQKLGTHHIAIVRNGQTVLDFTTKQATVASLPIQNLEFIVEGTAHDRSYFQRASEDPTVLLEAQLADMTAQRDTALAQVTQLTGENAALTTQVQTLTAKAAQAMADLT